MADSTQVPEKTSSEFLSYAEHCFDYLQQDSLKKSVETEMIRKLLIEHYSMMSKYFSLKERVLKDGRVEGKKLAFKDSKSNPAVDQPSLFARQFPFAGDLFKFSDDE
ncbi:hypothetical protein GEMRC1_012417 [Eukaryota sp. GEM-RC1]